MYPTDVLSEDFKDSGDFISTCSVSYIAHLDYDMNMNHNG